MRIITDNCSHLTAVLILFQSISLCLQISFLPFILWIEGTVKAVEEQGWWTSWVLSSLFSRSVTSLDDQLSSPVFSQFFYGPYDSLPTRKWFSHLLCWNGQWWYRNSQFVRALPCVIIKVTGTSWRLDHHIWWWREGSKVYGLAQIPEMARRRAVNGNKPSILRPCCKTGLSLLSPEPVARHIHWMCDWMGD
jgi:hypothetical protein